LKQFSGEAQLSTPLETKISQYFQFKYQQMDTILQLRHLDMQTDTISCLTQPLYTYFAAGLLFKCEFFVGKSPDLIIALASKMHIMHIQKLGLLYNSGDFVEEGATMPNA
jgi:hypothetical protein